MMNIRKFLGILLLFANATLYGQNVESNKVGMADDFRSSGKIFVVVAVVVIILSGLLIYIASIDRKLRKLEKESNEKK